MRDKPREIVYFLPDLDGGVASVVRNLLQYRSDLNNIYKVILTRINGRGDKKRVDWSFFKSEKIVFNYSSEENIFDVCKRLNTYISSEESILIANDGLELRMANILGIRNPLLYICHGDNNYYYSLVNSYFNSIDKVICVSSFIKQQIVKDKPAPGKVAFIPFPVPIKVNQEIQRKVDQSVDLVFVGSLTESKGVKLLPEIFHLLKAKGIRIKLHVVGDGPLHRYLEAECSGQDVLLYGHCSREQISDLLNKSQFLIHPSFAEGLPNVVVEAMKCGCIPVVSDLHSGVPDIIINGENGFVAELGNVHSFVSIISSAIHRADLFEIRTKAIKTASEKFDAFQQAFKYQELILNTTAREDKAFNTRRVGGVLNQKWLPNALVKTVRRMKISEKL